MNARNYPIIISTKVHIVLSSYVKGNLPVITYIWVCLVLLPLKTCKPDPYRPIIQRNIL